MSFAKQTIDDLNRREQFDDLYLQDEEQWPSQQELDSDEENEF